jgi:hypothetical protein
MAVLTIDEPPASGYAAYEHQRATVASSGTYPSISGTVVCPNRRGRGPASQPVQSSGSTSPMNRSSVSTSYGAGCSEITVRKPSSV